MFYSEMENDGVVLNQIRQIKMIANNCRSTVSQFYDHMIASSRRAGSVQIYHTVRLSGASVHHQHQGPGQCQN